MTVKRALDVTVVVSSSLAGIALVFAGEIVLGCLWIVVAVIKLELAMGARP